MKILYIKLKQLKYFHGDLLGVDNSVDIQVMAGKGTEEKLKELINHSEIFRIEITNELYIGETKLKTDNNGDIK